MAKHSLCKSVGVRNRPQREQFLLYLIDIFSHKMACKYLFLINRLRITRSYIGNKKSACIYTPTLSHRLIWPKMSFFDFSSSTRCRLLFFFRKLSKWQVLFQSPFSLLALNIFSTIVSLINSFQVLKRLRLTKQGTNRRLEMKDFAKSVRVLILEFLEI